MCKAPVSPKDNIEKLIFNHQRRLQKLKEQKALRGLDTPVEILIEIEDIEAAIHELQAELLGLLDETSLMTPGGLVEDGQPKLLVQISLQGDFLSLSADRQLAAIEAFAAVMGISPQVVEVQRVYEGSIVFDLVIPAKAIERLRFRLQTNSSQLHLLNVKRVVIERPSGEIEEWVVKGKAFHLATYSPLSQGTNFIMLRELERVSRQIVRDLRNRPGYGFLEEEDFVAQIYETARQDDECRRAAAAGDELTEPVGKLAKAIYSQALYNGCRSKQVKERNRAYEELSSYLYRIAYNYIKTEACPIQLAEDSTQQALTQIHKRLERSIDEPNWFLRYAITTINHECSRAVKKANKAGEYDERSTIRKGMTLSGAITGSLLDCLLQVVAGLPNKDWRTVLVLEHFAGFDDRDVAHILGTAKGNIQVMRHRAIHRLQTGQTLEGCFQNN